MVIWKPKRCCGIYASRRRLIAFYKTYGCNYFAMNAFSSWAYLFFCCCFVLCAHIKTYMLMQCDKKKCAFNAFRDFIAAPQNRDIRIKAPILSFISFISVYHFFFQFLFLSLSLHLHLSVCACLCLFISQDYQCQIL